VIGRRTGSDVLKPLGEDEVLVSAGGRHIVVPATCPHRGGRLRYGYVDEKRLRITCPLHYATFDLGTGERVAGPDCPALPVRELPQ